MREQIWLEWFCRQTFKVMSKKGHYRDPRYAFADYINEGIIALASRTFPGPRLLEDIWYSSLKCFSPKKLDQHSTISDAPSPVGLLLGRTTVNLLADARPPADCDHHWRASIHPNAAIYIDVPHGAFLLGKKIEQRDTFQLRAILLAPTIELNQFAERIFIAVVTKPGSEEPRGRLGGILTFGDRVSPLAGTDSSADFSLQAPYHDVSFEELARKRIADFVRLVLCYYLFGPEKSRISAAAAPSEGLRNGMPRKDEGLFAITRLLVNSDRLGRPQNSPRSTWSLTSRQEVDGHFRLQPFGPAASLRRLVWIEPYRRGPKDGAVKHPALKI